MKITYCCLARICTDLAYFELGEQIQGLVSFLVSSELIPTNLSSYYLDSFLGKILPFRNSDQWSSTMIKSIFKSVQEYFPQKELRTKYYQKPGSAYYKVAGNTQPTPPYHGAYEM